MIYADFESILLPEENEKQNSNQSYTNKYQKKKKKKKKTKKKKKKKKKRTVMVINHCVLMINLVSHLSDIQVKMLS